MTIHIYGSCAGTEPIKGWRHLSFSIDRLGKQYFFDAGESCGYTAYINGINIAQTRRIIISHTHMDHVGGLANLLWYIRKLDTQCGLKACPQIDIHIPNLETWEGIKMILKNTEGNFKCDFKIFAHEVSDGELFYDTEDDMKVTAYHNTHLPQEESGKWRSFSYLIESEGKKVFFTGDYGRISDFSNILNCNNIDLLMIETGHHTSESTASALKEAGIFPKILGFIHNGPDVRRSPDETVKKAEDILGVKTAVFTDGMTFEF